MEKDSVQYIADAEKVVTHDSDTGSDAILSEFTHEEERKIVHRIDRRLVTMVGLMYW
jgi:hypothetical protein